MTDASRRARQPWTRQDLLVLGGLAVIAAVGVGLGFVGATRTQAVAGLALILALAYCLSSARAAIDYRTVGWGLALQFLFALIVLKTAAASRRFRRPGGHHACAGLRVRRVVLRLRPARQSRGVAAAS